jgi:hypothetical protein
LFARNSVGLSNDEVHVIFDSRSFGRYPFVLYTFLTYKDTPMNLRNYACVILLYSLFSFTSTFAQSPQFIPYQAVARDSFGTPIPNTTMNARFSIRDGSGTGTLVYQETDTLTTSPLGIFTVVIGGGSMITGTFSGINWAAGAKYLQVELDPTGGTTYIDLGANQLLSVPYALYANSAAGGSSGTSLNGLHSAGDTIKLGGSLLDSVTYISLPFNTGIVFSPDSADFTGDGDFSGLGLIHRYLDGDTVLALGVGADFIQMHANKGVQINSYNSELFLSSLIRGDAAQIGEIPTANVVAGHISDAGAPLAYSGLTAQNLSSILIAHGYTGIESYLIVDSSKIFAAATESIQIATYNPDYHGSLNILQDDAAHTASSIMGAKDAVHQSAFAASPNSLSMNVELSGGGGISNLQIDTNRFYAQLSSGSGISLVPDNFNVSFNGNHLFFVDTSGNVSIEDKASNFYSELTNDGVLTNNRTYTLPNSNGVLPLSVNGQTADASGNIIANSNPYVAKTSAYTLTATDYTVNCTSGTFALTLPTAAGISGRTYVLNNSGSGSITINTTSSQTIDSYSSGALTISQYHNYILQSDGANWIILSVK